MKSLSLRSMTALVAVLVMISFTSAVRAADKVNVNGTWTWTQTGRNGNETKSTLKLKQDGDKVTGTLQSGANGRELEIKDGKLKDNELTFKIVRERNGNEMTTSYTGKVEGDTITGKVKSPGRNGGEGRERDWKATREKGEKAGA